MSIKYKVKLMLIYLNAFYPLNIQLAVILHNAFTHCLLVFEKLILNDYYLKAIICSFF